MSIYQRIFTDVEAKIISGDWRPGDRIPVEHELAAEYRCSRMTVSKALSALAERGMIVRRRKTGSFVASPQIDRTVMDIQDISTEAELAGHEHRFEILARKIERLGEAEAQQLSEPADAEILRLQCLHIVDGRPNAIERRIIMLDAVPRAREESFASIPPGKWLLDEVPGPRRNMSFAPSRPTPRRRGSCRRNAARPALASSARPGRTAAP